ncbi:hypothetical protein BJ508DRAFT_333638 [Ascobolus immersus RN42]|uniref:Uncharacterized protein n=1 Tax=Ascobolus immersus RN42 TaxID=1160509 RepID=A0A3N4HMY5_ASCIM|nr:hypothetical protein BJ508DRAFT_333638 [Ascobolus immersus RN42]
MHRYSIQLDAQILATIFRWTPSEIAHLGVGDLIKNGYNPTKSPHIDAETYDRLITAEREKWTATLDRLIAESRAVLAYNAENKLTSRADPEWIRFHEERLVRRMQDREGVEGLVWNVATYASPGPSAVKVHP